MLRFLRPLAAAAALSLAAGPALAEPPVWVVRDEDSTILMFGSVHLLPRGLDWAPDRLTETLKRADDLWFEIPMDPAASSEVSQLAAARTYLPADQTLSSLLDEASRRRLQAAASALGLSMTQLDRIRPWMAEALLMVAFVRSRGAESSSGVEEAIQALAPPQVERRAFETPEQQIEMLSGGSLSAQVESLQETLREIEEDPGGFDRMVEAWMAGDAGRLAREAVDPLREEAPDIYQRLVAQRNRAWAEQIRQRLAGSGVTVMVVGAGHLVGPDSVPALLRARGVTVEGP